jgi:C4-dicarboxylate-specific signal transduction histidine kinase
MTDRKRAEDALRQTRAELARVARVTAMGELTASIAHEITQPLSAVVTNSHTCLHWLGDKTFNLVKARSAATRTVRDAELTTNIIAHIRALMIKSEIERVPLDVNDIVGEVLALCSGELQYCAIRVKAALAARLPPVLGDRVQVQQLLLNLILNAIEAMAGVTDRVKELTVETCVQNADYVLVRVHDLGVGVGLEQAEQIFAPFFSTKPGGTGMGLTICRSIVEAHNGRIWSSPGTACGAVFQFTLPIDITSPSVELTE